ncbi:MAG: ATP-binding cassette domain-containing protein, partial [Bacteroidales bacterium]
DVSSMNIKFPPAPRSGTVVVNARKVTKRYGSNTVLDDLDLIIERGEKIAFVGRNGEGKTTLSRIIAGDLEYLGECRIGYNVSIGYYAQNQDELLDGSITVLDTIDRVAVGDIRAKIRDMLGAFLFSGEDVDKKVRVLSGGERSRLALARLLLNPCNLLVLDEPTNHLDIRSKEILKQALKYYDGTLIVVSHDREFLNGLTDKIYEFRGGSLYEYRGGIYDFLEKRKVDSLDALNTKAKRRATGEKKDEEPTKKSDYALRKRLDRKMRQVENKISSTEKRIEEYESKIEEMEKVMAGNREAQDIDFYRTYEQLKQNVDLAIREWEKFQNILEKLKAERNSVL